MFGLFYIFIHHYSHVVLILIWPQNSQSEPLCWLEATTVCLLKSANLRLKRHLTKGSGFYIKKECLKAWKKSYSLGKNMLLLWKSDINNSFLIASALLALGKAESFERPTKVRGSIMCLPEAHFQVTWPLCTRAQKATLKTWYKIPSHLKSLRINVFYNLRLQNSPYWITEIRKTEGKVWRVHFRDWVKGKGKTFRVFSTYWFHLFNSQDHKLIITIGTRAPRWIRLDLGLGKLTLW